MASRILTLNVGAGKILLAEFSVKSGKSPVLLNYGISGRDPQSDTGNADLGLIVRSIMKERGIRPAPLMVSISGQMAFSRFVKLPAMKQEELQNMVQYEVQQNVPFPMDEIVWNSQFLGDGSLGEQAVMIVAAKIDAIREITDSLIAVKLDPVIVDVAPMALYNCLRYNNPELDGCTILLDIGARSTNLVFVEDDKIYSRAIPVAGNAITQEIARVLEVDFSRAERLKRERAFVSLGGVTQASDEVDESISKIARNVATRLHAEISRSINFYRSQQGGSVPVRMILTGGSAVLSQLDTFFREKLHVEVDVLNPFANVNFGSRVNKAQLEHDAFSMGESVGLALRRSMKCPVEINLLPPEIIEGKIFRRRIPFLVLGALGVLASLGIWTVYEKQMAGFLTASGEEKSAELGKWQSEVKKLQAAEKAKHDVLETADGEKSIMGLRTDWLRRIGSLNLAMSTFHGLWITAITPVRDGEGPKANVTGMRIVGRGWNDKIRKLESKGAKGTVIEQLRDRIQAQPPFGKCEVKGVKDIGGYLTEFTIEASFAAPGADKEQEQAEKDQD